MNDSFGGFMRNLLRFWAAVSLVIFMVTGLAGATGSIRITSDLENEKAAFGVSLNGAARAVVNLDVQALEIAPLSLNGDDYKEIRLPAADLLFDGETAEVGKPALPVLSSYLAVPDQAGIRFTVEYSGYDIIENIDLAPVQSPQPESGKELASFTIDMETYGRDEFYPGELAEVGDPVIMRDLRMVQISMYPVQYNPARKELRIYRDLSVDVSFDGGEIINPKTTRHQYLSDGFYPIYRSMVANFDQFFSTTEVRRGGYLILVKDTFVDTLRAIADWKHKKGYTVYIAPTSEIDPNGSSPTAGEVHQYIENAYHNWEVPPEYVMIVGDESGSYSIPDSVYQGYASDHPYATVDGNDYLPDIFVSRLSVSSLYNLAVAMAKVLDYEYNPLMSDPGYWRRGLSVAGNVYATTPRITTLWVRQLLLQNGFTHVDTSFRWSSGQSDPNLLGYFNSGPCIISYRGWAGSSGWYSPSFNTGNLGQIQNHNKIGVMASIVCGTGEFDSYECFGEKWIRMGASTTSYKGGPAFFGSTDWSTHTRWNNPIMTGYYWGIFKEGIHHFAAAAVRGKIQQYNTFPRQNYPGGTIQKYFHTYNMLGDPELEIRTKVPVGIEVQHPPTLGRGINLIEISIVDNFDSPLEGAYVTLVKESDLFEEVFEVGRTDASGNISMSFDAATTGTMYLTASGRDLIPYRGEVSIVDEDVTVALESFVIDDDNFGHSSGNDDGIANPGEIIELTVNLKNFGNDQTAYDITGTLHSIDDELSTVYDAMADFGDIAPGQSSSSDSPFTLRIESSAQDGEVARLKISADDNNGGSWSSVIRIPVEAPKFKMSSVSFPGGNGRLDPGETLDMVLTLENIGSIDAQGVRAIVTADDDYTSLETAESFFGDIPVDNTADNSDAPMVISSDAETFDGRTLNLVLHTVTSSGAESRIPFAVTVGNIQSSDPFGPDAYGYYIYDNTDADYTPRPTYEWVEIVPNLGGQGTRINFGNTDDKSALITLPFDFVYYGDMYDRMIVCTNGFAAVDTTPFDMGGNYWYNFYNWPLPDPGNARGQLSPFWDDLSYSGSTYGVYTWHDNDNHRFIIEWYHMSHRNTGSTETFEMIIANPEYHPTLTGDSEIYYQYKTIYNNDSGEHYASVGTESFDGLIGLEYTYDNFYADGAATLTNGRALKITTNTGRGAVGGNVDLSNGGFNQDVEVRTSTGQRRVTAQRGDYWIKDVPPGEVDVTAEISGYFPATIAGVMVDADMTTEGIDFILTVCPVPENLDASEGLEDRIELTWIAVDHPEVIGYNVYRAGWENSEFEKLNADPITDLFYADYSIPDDGVYWYYVTAIYSGDYGDAESLASNKDYGSAEVITGIDDQPAVPLAFFLSQNYPNPFNPTTTISYGLSEDAFVKIDIFNLLGQKVRTLMDEHQKAGYRVVIWDGRDSSGDDVSSGVYFYTIKAGDFRASKKMLMIR